MANGAEGDAHLHLLRTLCEQAEALRKVAEDLCKRLEESRARLLHIAPPIERRRKPTNKTR